MTKMELFLEIEKLLELPDNQSKKYDANIKNFLRLKKQYERDLFPWERVINKFNKKDLELMRDKLM